MFSYLSEPHITYNHEFSASDRSNNKELGTANQRRMTVNSHVFLSLFDLGLTLNFKWQINVTHCKLPTLKRGLIVILE